MAGALCRGERVDPTRARPSRTGGLHVTAEPVGGTGAAGRGGAVATGRPAAAGVVARGHLAPAGSTARRGGSDRSRLGRAGPGTRGGSTGSLGRGGRPLGQARPAVAAGLLPLAPRGGARGPSAHPVRTAGGGDVARRRAPDRRPAWRGAPAPFRCGVGS